MKFSSIPTVLPYATGSTPRPLYAGIDRLLGVVASELHHDLELLDMPERFVDQASDCS